MVDRWAGCRRLHIGRDNYRVIWAILPPEEDYEAVADEVVPVYVLMVGPKLDESGTIYDRPRPAIP